MMEKWTWRRENYFHVIFKSHTLYNTSTPLFEGLAKGTGKAILQLFLTSGDLLMIYKIH